jgi:hypothetical protein
VTDRTGENFAFFPQLRSALLDYPDIVSQYGGKS